MNWRWGYHIHLNKEMDLASLSRNSLYKGSDLPMGSDGELFLHTLSIPTLGPKEDLAIFLRLMGRVWGSHHFDAFKAMDPRHWCGNVNSTHSLSISLTQGFLHYPQIIYFSRVKHILHALFSPMYTSKYVTKNLGLIYYNIYIIIF